MTEVIAIFDIGKTNKKILLFDTTFNLVYQEESVMGEIADEDGYPCDDIEKIENWILNTIQKLLSNKSYRLRAINFASYGASLAYLDDAGKRLTPVYNYLKPMREEVLKGFYEQYGGMEEFSRKTASPALGMLNSGLQILWLKKTKPDIFRKVSQILHFPQYLSYLLTKKTVSDYTSIGCHTALWNFDEHAYHPWLKDENIHLPAPVSSSMTFPVALYSSDQLIPVGIGIHDSSSSLVPYFESGQEKFILISTGTWCIFMNPFNNEPLTLDQLKNDTLCYLSVQESQVKSSRLFLGHIFDVNVKRVANHFGVAADTYKNIKPDETLLATMHEKLPIFFNKGIPENYMDDTVDLNQFESFETAYHQLVLDITRLAVKALKLIVPGRDETRKVYISGGFAHNTLFTRIIATCLRSKDVYTSEIENSTALGAAIVLKPGLNGFDVKTIELGLKKIEPFPFQIN